MHTHKRARQVFPPYYLIFLAVIKDGWKWDKNENYRKIHTTIKEISSILSQLHEQGETIRERITL